MGESLNSDNSVREYLLGRVSDETTLEGIEDLLFTDEEFCSRVALAEDEIINDYVFGRLDAADAESLRSTLAGNPDRRFKLELTQALREKALARNLVAAEGKPSFLASLKAFFRQPMYAGAFAVFLIAVAGLAIYLSRTSNPDELAELRSIYQRARPTESRISEFSYAPLPQLRGAPEPAEQNRLRRIENRLIEATEKNPNADTRHALGVFYLTQRDYPRAIKEFEAASKFPDKRAKLHNDLGVAHFELAKTGPAEKRLEELSRSVEEFTRAIELDPTLLEALFNKSLALQELGLSREAKGSWTLYLQKDSSSQWAEEARKNLARLENGQGLVKPDEKVLSDFLTAYQNHDDARAQKIHNETKGSLKSIVVPLQLSRRYLLARQRDDRAEAKESLDALAYIGNFEHAQSGDSFFFELANFYANVGADKTERLLQAKDLFAEAYRSLSISNAKAISEFEQSRDIFEQVGNTAEAGIAEIWAAQIFPDLSKIAEGRQRLSAFIAYAQGRNFKVLLHPAYYWLGISNALQGEFSESNKNLKTALRLSKAGNNVFEAHHAADDLVTNYTRLGELESVMAFASQMLPDAETYYSNPNQLLRDKGTFAELTLKMKFFSTSLSFAREALSMAQENWPDSSRVISPLSGAANAAGAKGDFDLALKYANDSMNIALTLDDSAENTRTKARAYLLLADLRSKTKDWQEALKNYDQALESFGRLPEVTFSLYQIHKGKLECFERLDRQQDFTAELKIVMDLSEQYRSAIREDSSRQAFFANEQGVFDAAAANAIAGHDSRKAFDYVEASRARSLLDFVESGKSITEVEKRFGPVARPLSVTEIQARLPEQVQLVQYAVLPDKLAIWLVSRTRFDLVERQITAAELEDKINAYQTAILEKGPPAEIRRTGQELYELLIPPGLAAEKQLCLVPDKSLHQLPFATLLSPSGKYLLQDFALFYAPSASVLVVATENARHKEAVVSESLLSIGNPDFDREENPNLPDLRDADAEARTIAADYSKALDLAGAGATRKSFLENFSNVEVIHFAGHFVANRQSPGNSKLLFAGGDLRSNQLSAYQLPRAKLVVLSACETGYERYNKSEGAIGIARTLLAMGAPLVVASQWKVDSEPAKNLMIAFHRNRRQRKMTSAESLRQAQLEMLGRDETKAPFYWAAFSLFGGYANY